jgi:membrane protein insertase Oxa1/YidC/SpoIIIJ
MDNLEFRKFLTTYGINQEEYEKMDDGEKQKLKDKYNNENKEKSREEKADNLEKIGNGLHGCGCLLLLIPILIGLLYILYSIIF